MLQLVIGQLINGVIIGTLYGIIALGVTLTFGITGIVNFALGDVDQVFTFKHTTAEDEIALAISLAGAFHRLFSQASHFEQLFP